jgi:hypothetical protein
MSQDDPADKEIGINSVDTVYRRNLYPMGFSTGLAGRQEDLDSLEALMHDYEAPEGDEFGPHGVRHPSFGEIKV